MTLRGVPRLVASDLDGTLVRSDGTISSRTAAALTAAQAAGATIVFVTGRPPRWMTPVVAATGLDGIAICANGALVYDIAGERLVAEYALSPEDAAAIAADIRARVPEVQFAVESAFQFGHEPAYRPSWPTSGQQIAPLEELVRRPVAKLLVKDPDRHPELIVEAVQAAVGERAVVTWSGDVLLEVSAAGVSKASTLAALCAERGIGADQVVAFGDMPNDLALLSWAGLGVAMANAHPDVLATADERTASNDDDGVALVVERLFGLPRSEAGGGHAEDPERVTVPPAGREMP